MGEEGIGRPEVSGVGVSDGAAVEVDVGVDVACPGCPDCPDEGRAGAEVSGDGVVVGGEVSAAGTVGVGVAVAA